VNVMFESDFDPAILEKRIRSGMGAPCPTQARVLGAIMRRLRPDGSGTLPNLSEIARELSISRQRVSASVRSLNKKGVLEVARLETVTRRRREYSCVVLLTGEYQLPLPLNLPEPLPA
jgi:hypothetical protein